MTQDWYPGTLRVSENGARETYGFMQSTFSSDQPICYAEFGIWKADTARRICELFPNAILYLFDFDGNIEAARQKLAKFGNQIHYFGNTQRYNDSYNWSLMKLIQQTSGQAIFDYCYLDGAHTVAVDALNFFLCDRLLRVGGYLDFDDYDWSLAVSSLRPDKVPEILLQYTEEQIEAKQVKMIVDDLVKPDPRYIEVVANKVFRKIG